MAQINKQARLNELYTLYKNCTSCALGTLGRQNTVFGHGNSDASLMIVGEAPGKEEDSKGIPFIGKSGRLLTKSIEECGIILNEVFITNIVKCRPPNNRNPLPKEIGMCKNILLFNQIKIIQPKIIAAIGAHSLQLFTKNKKPKLEISKVHGQVFNWNNILIVPLYHPAYILCNNKKLPLFLDDIALLKELLDKNSDK